MNAAAACLLLVMIAAWIAIGVALPMWWRG